jgi:hypothetical protein
LIIIGQHGYLAGSKWWLVTGCACFLSPQAVDDVINGLLQIPPIGTKRQIKQFRCLLLGGCRLKIGVM